MENIRRIAPREGAREVANKQVAQATPDGTARSCDEHAIPGFFDIAFAASRRPCGFRPDLVQGNPSTPDNVTQVALSSGSRCVSNEDKGTAQARIREAHTMNSPAKLHHDWRHVATVEVADNSDALEHVIDDHASCYRVQHACGCPDGCSGFNILVDFGMADRQAAHAAYAVLSAAQKAACRGIVLGYRIIGAQYWEELARILGHDGDATMPVQARADASIEPTPKNHARTRAASKPRASRPTKVASRGRAKK